MSQSALKVLLVEDDEDDYLMTRQLLSEIEGRKYDVTWAATYQEALAAIKTHVHDVCLMDYQPGEHNGVEILYECRAQGYNMPVILLAGAGDHSIGYEAIKAGAADCLVKADLNKALLERSINYAIEHNAMLAALRESENRYRRIVETTSEGIWTFDAEGRTTYVNQRMAEMLGYDVEEMFGRSYFDFINEKEHSFVSELLLNRNRGLAGQYELQVRHRDGRNLWMSVSASPLFDDDQFIGTLKMLADITARKQNEEERQSFFNYSFDMLAVAGFDGFFKRLNPAWERTLGFTIEELMSKRMVEFIHPDDCARTDEEMSKLSNGITTISFENRDLCKDGSYKHLLWSSVPNTKQQVVYAVAHDITERKRNEEERSELIARLAAEKGHFSEIFKHAPAFIATVRGAQHFFETANPAYYQHVGHRDLIGIPVREALPDIEDQGLFELLDQVRETGEPFTANEYSVRIQLNTNEPPEQHYVNFVYMPMREADGAVYGVLCHGVDVTEQVLARFRIQESEERYRDLIENSLDLICTHDLDGRILSVNQGAANLLGYEPEALLEKNIRDILAPEFKQEFEDYRNSLVGKGVATGEMLVLTKSGERRIWEYRNSLRTQGVASPIVRGIAHDVTERWKAERALKESEQRYRFLFENNPLPMWVFSLDSLAFLAVNEAAINHYGYTREEFLAMTALEIHPAEDVPDFLAHVQTSVHGLNAAGVFRHRKKDGTIIYVEVTSSRLKLDGKEARLVLANDITERLRAEDAVRQAEEKYRGIFENAIEGIFQSTPEGKFIAVNPAMARMFGYESPEALINSINIEQHFYVDPFVRAEMKGLLEVHGSVQGFESQAYRRDGSVMWISENAYAVHEAGSTGVYYEGTIEDITEQKHLKESLRAADRRAISEYERLLDRLAALAQALGTARELFTIYRALRDFSLVSVPCSGLFVSLYNPERNERQAVYAWSAGEEVDLSCLPLMPMTESPHSRAVATNQIIITDDFQAATANTPATYVGSERDPRLPQSSLVVPMAIMGRTVGAIEVQSTELAIYTQEHATSMRMAANLAASAIENVQLIEREHQHEEQLRQSQKMEAVGHLAGGVAHDFNNLLTAINGYSDLALRRVKNDELLSRQLSEIKKAGERAASLTRQLLAFSRKQVLQPKVLNLNDVVADTIKMLHRLIGEDIEITTALNAGLGQVKADPGQMEQVLMNLVVNARDAMPKGGRITIRTENVLMDEETAEQYVSVRVGAHIRLTVSDTGCGMDAETQKRIFEPFFTTKEVGAGTGLGLSTVYGIVKQSDGYISVYSELDHGTSFKIYLPRVDAASESTAATEAAVPRGSETVLLVEDDELVRKIANTILEKFGYTVLVTASGTEALQICAEYEGRIHLMLTDVVMPQMSGKELSERAMELRPGMKVLYMSGYTDDFIVHHGVLDEGIPFLEKPFTPDALAQKVRGVLSAS